MKRILKILLYCAVLPLAASLPGFALSIFAGLPEANVVLVPLTAAAICFLFRKRMDTLFAAKTYGVTLLILLVCFTVMMLISSGSVEGALMANFCWLILPLAPVVLVYFLMGQYAALYVTAFLTYAALFAVTAVLGKFRTKKALVPAVLAAVCVITSAALYVNRPAARYAGHGFDYMHGYSSTDFTDYMVYSENSKLAVLDHSPELVIEDPEDMPVMDGAEACYPLYAAFAKAVYKDIASIEKQWLDGETRRYMQYMNGRIVTFTNTVVGFSRLLDDPEKYGGTVDMFFGARPSASQLAEAERAGVELEITPIAREAFVFFVEEDNPVSDLTSEQIKAIYHGDITNWKELGGKDREIVAFQRPENSGSQTMMRYFMGDISLKAPQTYEKIDAMSGVIREVAQYANEKGAIGYSFRYFLEELGQERGVKMLRVDGVYPSVENIENGSYPLTVSVCLITRADSSNPNVERMRDFILSEDGQTIVRKTGYAGIGG